MTCHRVLRATIRLILLLGLLYPGTGLPAPTGQQGKIRGESHVNIRSGPDLSFPPVAVTKQGDIVTVEGEEKGWYRVVLSSGTKGYVDKALIDPIVTVTEEGNIDPSPASAKQQVQAPKSRPLPTIPSMRQWEALREREALKWVVTVLGVFGLGWILGGNYYLRRDRMKRRKLQL